MMLQKMWIRLPLVATYNSSAKVCRCLCDEADNLIIFYRVGYECLDFLNDTGLGTPGQTNNYRSNNRMKYINDCKVDLRTLKSGDTRLRLKPTSVQHELYLHAMDKTGYKKFNPQADCICMNFLGTHYDSGISLFRSADSSTKKERLLIHIYPDQIDLIEQAFEEALEVVDTAEGAYELMCRHFLRTEFIN